MKTIWKIYKRDFKRLSRNVVALVVAVGICILPALYAWFNIAANWDPYGNTGGIQVAVVNDDKGSTADGITFALGEQIVENLKANDAIGWTFMDDKDALEGVKSGKYYAAIVIPEDFSEKMAGILSGTIESPNLKYYVNEKKNAIAPKITDKGATSIQQQVNSTFISVAAETVANVMNVASGELDSNGVTLIDRLITNLKSISTDLEQYEATIDAFSNVADSVAQLTSTARLTIPDIDQVLQNGRQALNSTAGALETSRNTAGTVTSSLGNVMESTAGTFDSISSLTNQALQNLENDADGAADKMNNASGICDYVINKNNVVLEDLETLKEVLPEEHRTLIQGTIDQLTRANEQQTALRDQIIGAADNIRNSTANAEEIRNSIAGTIDQSRADLSSARTSYQNDVQPQLNSMMDNISNTASSLGGLLTSTDSSLSNLDGIFSGLNGAMSSGQAALSNTKSVINTTQNKLKAIIVKVEGVSEDQQLNMLIDVLKSDPELTGEFMSSPVQLDTTSLYPIENYGSAMAPFYSILAIWVGSIVLVAIMKVHVDEDDEISSIKPTQGYLGRYLTFLTFGLVQATVIALGDLFYLGIQCKNYLLFFVCAWVASFVFTNIIYALTVSFGAIGKAISVILLVVQIGGSGGTFPIEVTPEFFRTINPILPFTYGINAMRECVAGIYKMSYWKDIMSLLIYVPLALLLGLLLRRPLIKVTEFFEKRLEDSKLL